MLGTTQYLQKTATSAMHPKKEAELILSTSIVALFFHPRVDPPQSAAATQILVQQLGGLGVIWGNFFGVFSAAQQAKVTQRPNHLSQTGRKEEDAQRKDGGVHKRGALSAPGGRQRDHLSVLAYSPALYKPWST